MMLSSASAAVRRSSSVATTGHRLVVSVVSPPVTDQCVESTTEKTRVTARHLFSSSPVGRGAGRGGGRGAGRGGGGGRGAGAFKRFRERRAAHAKKPNFAKTVLEPAARGELQKGHWSGIPKLTGRKGKGHAVHDTLSTGEAQHLEDVLQKEEGGGEVDEEEDIVKEETEAFSALLKGTTAQASVKLSQVVMMQQQEEYDSEAEYDEMEGPTLAEFEQHPYVTKHEDGTYTIEYDSDWGEDSDDDDEQEAPGRRRDFRRDRREDQSLTPNVNPEAAFFYKDVMDFSDPFPNVPPEQANRLLPLRDHGPDLDDFLEAMIEHPTKYAEVKRYNLHPESLREAKPEFSRDVKQPDLSFVKAHKRFLFVTGLPKVVNDEDEGDFDNPLHRHEVQKIVSKLFNVKSEHVSPANMTSAFVGYTTVEARQEALQKGLSQKTFANPIQISKLDPSVAVDNEFIKESPDCIVQLFNLPPNKSVEHWCRNLFPAETEVGSIYGPLSEENFTKTSSTTALVRFASAEQAASAVESLLVLDHFQQLGQTRVRFFTAKRELLPAGYTGPNNAHEAFKRGPRLVIDGQVPSKQFYTSHFEVIELKGLDNDITKQELADFFQPYCIEPRDVQGSVEFVTCAEGLRTDRAFVGFDVMGQAEAVLKALGETAKIGNCPVQLKAVEDKPQRRGEKRESRPLRTEEELLDSLNNWEQYVEKEDLEYLLNNGVRKEVLDDAFMTMRYKNKTFGPTDWAMQREKLNPELEQGDIYRTTVQKYIKILKDCMATPENPGLMYKNMFLPDEDMDLSAFDREKERQEKLRKERSKVL